MSFVSSRKGFNLNKISLLRKELIATLLFALKAAAFFFTLLLLLLVFMDANTGLQKISTLAQVRVPNVINL